MKRILIVDDKAENRYLLQALLQGHGHHVEEASNGAEALAVAHRTPPDLVVADLLMPVMDGYTLLRHWKSDAELRAVPFLVYTATYTEPRDERLALNLGADAFLLKPCEPEPLLARINELLEGKSGKEPTFAAHPPDEGVILKEYSEALVRKLEDKVQELERTNIQLLDENTERRRTETALRDSEERYRNLFNSITVPLFIYDRETLAYLAVNDSAVAQYGYSREEFLRMNIKDVRPPEDVPSLLEMLARAGTAMENRGVWRHQTKDGRILDAEISAFGLDFSGRPACLVASRDVTEHRRAEAEVAKTNDLLRAVADGTPDAVFIKDLNGKYLLFNEAAARFVGKPVNEVIGRDDTSLFGDDDVRRIQANDRFVMDSNQVSTTEERLTAAGVTRTYLATKAPYRDAAGNVVGIIGISRDITDRKQAQKELQLRDRAIQAVSQGILIADPNQPDIPIIYASSGFERITGYLAEEVLGKNCRFLQGKDTDLETVAKLRQAIADGETCAVEILNYRRDGTSFWNALSLSPIRDENGELAYYVGVQSDVTSRRNLEEQLRQAQKMEAIGQLAGGVAHDFNNLLTIISGYSELVVATPDISDSVRESVEAIREAGGRAADLTQKLLAFSRQTMLDPKVLNLNDIIRETSRMLKRLIGEDIRFTTILSPQLHPVRVDSSHLDQVLMNLAVNARDAMPTGGNLTIETANVELSAEYADAHPGCRPGPHVLLAISDTGCGMSPDVIARIFEPFFTTKGIGKGTGLGLPMVFGIVRQSGGCIHVYSELNRGSTFKIYLPAVIENFASQHEQTPEVGLGGTETILLAEDEDEVRRLALKILEAHGYKVLTATDGKDALRIVDNHPHVIDLLLTDVVMPAGSGPELAQVLRQRFPRLKVLFMSGYTDDAVVRHGLLHAEVSFIQKPFTPLSLLRKVRHTLDDHALPAS